MSEELVRQAIIDEEHLKLLSLGYMISAATSAFFSLFGLMYMIMGIFMHEVGHALGIFGHSDKPSDLMYPNEIQPAGHGKPTQVHSAPVSLRDINTLKKIYESPAVPQTISLDQPLEWSLLMPDR